MKVGKARVNLATRSFRFPFGSFNLRTIQFQNAEKFRLGECPPERLVCEVNQILGRDNVLKPPIEHRQ